MQIRIHPIPAYRELQGISFFDDDTFNIDFKSVELPGEHFIKLSRAEAIFIQYHLNELLEKHPG